MEIDRVDLVDAGANGRRFALFKRDATAAPNLAAAWLAGAEEKQGLVAKLAAGVGEAVARVLGIQEPVVKTMTFAQIVAGEEMSDALEEHWTTLQSALWSALYAYDDDGNALSLDAKKQLVGQNLDEFKTFLLERMEQGVTKQDGPVESRLINAMVAKVGRKVSAARLARLKEAADALTAVLAEVEADEATTKKRATPHEEEDMSPEELAAAIAKGLEPITARLDALEKGEKPDDTPDPGTKVTKGGDAEEESDDDELPAPVAKAFESIFERLEKIETQRGVRQSATPDEAAPVVKNGAGKTSWDGLL